MITGTLGDAQDHTVIHVHIEEQCENAQLALYPNPPLPAFTEYTLRDPLINLNWNTNDILTSNIHKHCGDPVYIVLNSDGTELDSELFEQKIFEFGEITYSIFTIVQQ